MSKEKNKEPQTPVKPKEITGPVSIFIKNSKQVRITPLSVRQNLK